MKNLGAIVAIGIVVFLGIIYFGMKMSYVNKAVGLENKATAQTKLCTIKLDETWKTVQQKAEVTDKSVNDFKEIFNGIMEKRYSPQEEKQLLTKFVVESNPTFDNSLFQDLSRYIESSRKEFNDLQAVLIDIEREHTDLRTKAPGSWFVGGRPAISAKVITSTKTEEIYKTGKEDDISVFGKDKGK